MRQHKKVTPESEFSILTVDDDPIMTSTVQAYFQRSGYRVDVENDPYRAIERVRAGSYDILLLDFLMTPICGDQVVEEIRKFNHELFIILLTGHKSMAPPIRTIRALEIQGYYEKSDRFDQLELLVESCVKAIRQMRTIRTYKDGLAAIVDSLPHIYDLTEMDHLADTILATALSILPAKNAVLLLDGENHQSFEGLGCDGKLACHTAGEACPVIGREQADSLFEQLQGKTSLLLNNQLVLPILDGAQLAVGLLAVELQKAPSSNQIQLMEVFVRQASSAIFNARFHTLLQEKNFQLDHAYNQLQNSYFEMISAIRRMVDMKDPYTCGHSDRVSYYATRIARKMGLPEATCERIRIAGLFHDVGKLSVPDSILLKPGRLTDEEYQSIKQHPVKGEEILRVLSGFRPILPAVRSHHERLDGRGYPDGLRGEAIPLDARIIAVADTFDAMTSNRQYRAAMPLQKAVDELERCRGTQLDPEIVDVFLALVRDPGFWKEVREDCDELIANPTLDPDAAGACGGTL